MKRKIFLHGYLKDLHPEPIEVEATTVAEALRVLEQIPALKPTHGLGHPVRIDGILTDMQLFGANEHLAEIHLRPNLGGAGGNNGMVQILLGIALVAVAIWLGPGVAVLGGWLTSSTILMAGAGLILGGVLQMMMSTPEDSEEAQSKYLPATENTVEIGTPIPMVFGARMVGGHVLSLDSDSKTVTSDITGGTKGITRRVLEKATAAETKTYNAQEGLEEFSTGAWAYEGSRTERVQSGGGRSDVEYLNYTTVIARGYIDEIDPYALLVILTSAGNARGIPLTYSTRITVPTTGAYRFQQSSDYPFVIQINDLPPDANGDFQLTAGTEATIKVQFSFDYSLYTKQAVNLQVRVPGGVFEPIVNLVGTGSPDAPSPVNVEESLFVEYDQTPLLDGLTPIRPVFASAVASPTNIPTSEWRP